MPVDRGGECLEGGLAARQSRFGFMLTRCAEEVADSNALPPALELLPVSLDILELRERELPLAALARDLVLEALDVLDDFGVLLVASGIEVAFYEPGLGVGTDVCVVVSEVDDGVENPSDEIGE
jgi:hypothetical protein